MFLNIELRFLYFTFLLYLIEREFWVTLIGITLNSLAMMMQNIYSNCIIVFWIYDKYLYDIFLSTVHPLNHLKHVLDKLCLVIQLSRLRDVMLKSHDLKMRWFKIVFCIPFPCFIRLYFNFLSACQIAASDGECAVSKWIFDFFVIKILWNKKGSQLKAKITFVEPSKCPTKTISEILGKTVVEVSTMNRKLRNLKFYYNLF